MTNTRAEDIALSIELFGERPDRARARARQELRRSSAASPVVRDIPRAMQKQEFKGGKQMIATLSNMREHYREGNFAWSPDTGEEYSANPGDYWYMDDDDTLQDGNGNAMLLVYRATSYVVLGEEL